MGKGPSFGADFQKGPSCHGLSGASPGATRTAELLAPWIAPDKPGNDGAWANRTVQHDTPSGQPPPEPSW